MKITDTALQSGGAEWVRKAAGPTAETKASASSKGRVADAVSISGDARKLSSVAASSVRARVEALPDIREERIQEVRSRLESGYYDTEEFHGQLAAKMLQNASLA